MIEIDPRTPVIVGVAQKTVHRGHQPGPEPLLAWEETCRAAVADAGLDERMLAAVEGIVLTDCMSWRYDDPVARLAERVGADPAFRLVGPPSGTSGQTLVDNAATEVRQSRADLMLICGGEALATARHYRQAGKMPPWSYAHPDGPGYAFDLDGHQHPGEIAVGLTEGVGAVYGFAMRDIARRAHLGVAPEEYRRQLGETMAGLTRIAATNPNAWFSDRCEADFLHTPRPDNRYISYPYTKRMVAIIEVDITAALLIASEGWADANGVPRDRRVYSWTSCYAQDPVYIGVRPELWKSPGMEAAGRAVLDAAGLTIADISHIDLYSCFPAAVNFARDALGISDRSGEDVTVTGGLPYAGGPASSYMLTSIVCMARRLRVDAGAKGLIGGIGMMMSNHIYAIYSSTPPGSAVRQPDQAALQAGLNALPQHPIDDEYVGPATIATYTIMYDRDGLRLYGAAICDLPTGARSYVRIMDRALLEEAERSELVGREVEIGAGAGVGEIIRLME